MRPGSCMEAALTDDHMEPQAIQSGLLRGIRVAIASGAAQQRMELQRTLSLYGMHVTLSEPMSELFVSRLAQKAHDVLVLDLHEELNEIELECLEQLLDTTTRPIVFNDISALQRHPPAARSQAYGKLLRKIAEMTGKLSDAASLDKIASLPQIAMADATTPRQTAAGLARDVWVLGASLGGPQAVKRFLRVLPGDLPAAFVLAQHMGANFVSLLAEQLRRSTALRVHTPNPGHVLRHGEVLIAPVEERLLINPIGAVELHAPLAERGGYRPSITQIIRDMYSRYGGQTGAIIFSGLGDDGAEACRELVAGEGQAWVQSAQSCIISSMPDRVRELGAAVFEGTPEALAQRLIEHYRR